MEVEEIDDLNKWYSAQTQITDLSFNYEMIEYCRADVEVLSKAVLVLRKMFYDNVNIDPFRYITLPSLCMNIYKGRFLHDKSSIVCPSGL